MNPEAPRERTYRVFVTGTPSGEFRFDLRKDADIVGEGLVSVSFGGWTSPTFDTRDVTGIRAVIDDEHRFICEARRTDLVKRVEWTVDGVAVDGEPEVLPPPEWAIRPEPGRCMVEIDWREVEGRAGTWPVYCRKLTADNWVICPMHIRARRAHAQEGLTYDPPAVGGAL